MAGKIIKGAKVRKQSERNRKKMILFFKNDSKGFTLMELVVVMVVVGVLSVTIVPFIKVNIKSYIQVRDGKNALQAARIALNRMVEEMKRLQRSSDISWGFSHSIQFTMQDGTTIAYRTASVDHIPVIRRTENSSSSTLLEGVRAFNLTYFLSDGSQKSPPFWWPSDVWRIKIQIEVGTDEQHFTLSKQVTPRNF